MTSRSPMMHMRPLKFHSLRSTYSPHHLRGGLVVGGRVMGGLIDGECVMGVLVVGGRVMGGLVR